MSNELKIQQATDRAKQIQQFREETISRKPLPKVISSRTIVHNGRPITVYLMDASQELGRGRSYWLKPDITSAA